VIFISALLLKNLFLKIYSCKPSSGDEERTHILSPSPPTLPSSAYHVLSFCPSSKHETHSLPVEFLPPTSHSRYWNIDQTLSTRELCEMIIKPRFFFFFLLPYTVIKSCFQWREINLFLKAHRSGYCLAKYSLAFEMNMTVGDKCVYIYLPVCCLLDSREETVSANSWDWTRRVLSKSHTGMRQDM
jgi:hypothetical protein